MRKESTLLCVVLLTTLIPSLATAAIRYNVTDLGTLPGYESSRAWSINNKGQIVGEAFNGNPLYNNRAVLFDPNGAGNNIDLGTLGGKNSGAVSINNNGQIVGGADSNDPQQSLQPTIFDPNDGGNNIGLGEKGSASSINDHGQIVGCVGSIEDFSAVLFDPTGQGDNVDLGTLDGIPHSVAYSMNNSGQIVGYAYNDIFAQDFRAVLFDPTGQGNNIDLGTLGGEYSAAISINDYGQIVGRADTATGSCHAVLFDPNGTGNNVDLGILDGCNFLVATSINNSGQIVGQASKDASSGFRAVMFNPTGNGNNIDLNDLIDPTLGYSLSTAICINDNGWIVCWGGTSSFSRTVFLLIPIPAGPADFQRDGDVDLKDYAILTAAWRSTPADDNWNPFCDI
ncbi:MAG: hypothetical protein ACYSWZ_24225, partial [Planctomycetota bacterium]